MDPAVAFYFKQIFFTFLLPIVILVCVIVWSTIRCLCKKITKEKCKDYLILSIVLLTFLLYPTLVKMTLSMLRCPEIGGKFYLMASLQEECFQYKGAHSKYVLMLTIPQIIIYIIGLPLAGTIHLIRNKKHLHEEHFLMRYGLLYLGYRDERAWWELVIAFRKVAIVLIGTFGTFLGVVDIQAHLALLVVFISIALHLVGKPFDMEKPKSKFLYNLELVALIICWMTFWGGLLFFLGHDKEEESVSDAVKILVTVCIVIGNMVFLIVALFVFGKESIREKKLNDIKKKEIKDTTKIVPLQSGGDDNNEQGDSNQSLEENWDI